MGYKEEVIADSPTAYWPLSEANGSSTVTDTVSSVVLTINGSPNYGLGQVSPTRRGFMNSASANVVRFEKTTSVPANLRWALNTDICIEAIFRKEGTDTAFHGVVAHRTNSSTDSHFGLYVSNTVINMDVNVSTYRWTTTVTLDDKWHHVVARHVGSTGARNLWVDGVQVDSTTITKPPSASSNSSSLFVAGTPNGNSLSGGTSDVAIYNNAYLSDARIKAHYIAMLNESAKNVW